METLFVGIALIVVGFIVDWVFNPTSPLGCMIRDMFKLVGIIVAVVGVVQYYSNKPKYVPTPIIPNYVSDGDSETTETETLDMPTEYSVDDYDAFAPMPSSGYEYEQPSAPTGHYVEIEEDCSACCGRGYNLTYFYTGNDTKEIKSPCHRCHESGKVKRREFIME
ncbi:MAG: hypothetical protein NC113_07840 [Bacteroides sp.]|nr:hypothetical protein [Bacteroides sp.]MCM1448111.1 hypothetical protein [Bacteroides sp.]MCM1515549.1 hypothetical protein [Paraprevotella sp.]